MERLGQEKAPTWRRPSSFLFWIEPSRPPRSLLSLIFSHFLLIAHCGSARTSPCHSCRSTSALPSCSLPSRRLQISSVVLFFAFHFPSVELLWGLFVPRISVPVLRLPPCSPAFFNLSWLELFILYLLFLNKESRTQNLFPFLRHVPVSSSPLASPFSFSFPPPVARLHRCCGLSPSCITTVWCLTRLWVTRSGRRSLPRRPQCSRSNTTPPSTCSSSPSIVQARR